MYYIAICDDDSDFIKYMENMLVLFIASGCGFLFSILLNFPTFKSSGTA